MPGKWTIQWCSLIYFFCFCSFAAQAETFAGWSEKKTDSIPRVEVQSIDVPVPEVLLMQLVRQRKNPPPPMSPQNANQSQEDGINSKPGGK